MLILGIDFGACTTDAVLLQGSRIARKASSGKAFSSARELNRFLAKNNFGPSKISRIAVTGGKSSFFKGRILGLEPVHVDEINAIGRGAAFLSKSRRCLAVSLGTGTCIVLFERGKCRHMIGTGIGGGTILGLGRLLLGETGVKKLIGLAARGSLHKVDLSVRDVVGKGIGSLPPNATASNFAKGKGSRADLAAAVQSMVAESVAVLAVASARQCRCRKIVFIGKALAFPFVRKRLVAAAKCLGTAFEFPRNSGFGTAVGAAACLQGAG